MSAAKKSVNKVVLAYSGGLDTSCIVPWLVENYGCEVICFCANLGQDEELSGLEAKALASGASKLYIEDLREEFVTDYIYPTLKAGAIYEREYLLGTSFARPLIAKRMVEIAELEGADAVAHGATGKGNDQVRFELTVMALNPKLKIIAPWREWHIRSREDALEYAAAHNVPVTATLKSIYSRDRNLWHLSHEGGVLEDPVERAGRGHVPAHASARRCAPDEAGVRRDRLRAGRAQARQRRGAWARSTLVATLNAIGGKHGVGRVDLVENRLVGMKSRGVYETPGGTLLYQAHEGLEQICLDKQTLQYKQMLALKYAELVYNGQWFTPLREALDAFVDVTQKHVTGTSRLKLYKGNVTLVGPQVALQPLPRGLRHLRRGGRLQPEGRRGLHQAVRPADEGRGHARHRGHGPQQVRRRRTTPRSSATEPAGSDRSGVTPGDTATA